MTQLSITEAFESLEPRSPEPRNPEREPPSHDPLSRIEPQLDRLRRELVSELRSALVSLPEIQQELRRTGQATLELASPLRDLLNELEQLVPSLRVARPRRRWWGWIVGAVLIAMGVVITAQPAARIAVAKHLLPIDQRTALEMGEGLLRVYPRLSEAERRTLEQMLSQACASCSAPTTTPPSPSTTGPAAPPRPGSERSQSPAP
jgi:hypothetical protein